MSKSRLNASSEDISQTENSRNEKSRSNQRRTRNRMSELEEMVKSENIPTPRSMSSPVEDDKLVDRSNQKLITSDEERVEKKKIKVRKDRRESRDKTENSNASDSGSRINKGLESDSKTNDDEIKTKKTRRAKKKNTDPDEPDPNILAIIVHKTDKLRTHLNIHNPLVRIHILDLDNEGQYIRKTKKDRHVLFYYEKENRKLDFISPIMTTPFDFRQKHTIIPDWEEIIVFNEEFSHFTKKSPNVLIIFELIDSTKLLDGPMESYTSQDTSRSWLRIAWAFFKELINKINGANDTLNIEKKIRLQLYYSQDQYNVNMTDAYGPQVFNLYKSGYRVKYPASLHVTVKAILPPKPFMPGLGSSYLIEQENIVQNLENKSSTKNLRNFEEKESARDPESLYSDRKQSSNHEEDIMSVNNKDFKKKTVIWSRIAGLPCRVPNDLTLTLPSTKKGCYSIKFSVSGSYLACACVDENNMSPILVYSIPDGKLAMKFYGHIGLIYEMSWSKLDKYIVTASNDATARVFDVENQARDAFKIIPHPSFVYSAKFHPESYEIVCTAGFDKVVRVWSINSKKKRSQKYGELLQELSGSHTGYINSICFSTDGKLLYSGDSAGLIQVWNSKSTNIASFEDWTLKDDLAVDEIKNQCISYIYLHPNQFRIIVHLRDNQIKMVDLRLKSVVQRYKTVFNVSQNLKSTVTPCGTFLFNSGADTKLYCWNVNTGDEVTPNGINLNYLKPARDIEFHPYDNYIALCSFDNNAPVFVLKFNSEKAALDLNHAGSSQTNLRNLNDIDPKLTGREKDFSGDETIRMNKSKTSNKENDLQKKLADDVAKFNEYQLNRWKAVHEKLDSILPQQQNAAKSNQNLDAFGLPLKPNVAGSITMSMIDKNKPEFKYRGPKDVEDLVIALYDYKAQRSDELTFKKGDEILVLVKESDSWWLGEHVKTKQEGYLPANYVQDKSVFENIKKNSINPIKMPKYTVRDAMNEYEKVYEQSALEAISKAANDFQAKKSDTRPVVPNLNIGTNKENDSAVVITQPKSIVSIKNPSTLRQNTQKPNQAKPVHDDVIDEVPTRDRESENELPQRRNHSKRGTFAHIITGSNQRSSDA